MYCVPTTANILPIYANHRLSSASLLPTSQHIHCSSPSPPLNSGPVTDLDFGGEVDLLADLELVTAVRLPRRVSQTGGVVLDAHELGGVVLHLDE